MNFQISKLWKSENKCYSNLCFPILLRLFYAISTTLLSLLLPLSFLLLARLSSAHYLLSLTSNSPSTSLFHTLFLSTNPNILHCLVAFVSIATLFNALMGPAGRYNALPAPVYRPRLYVCWILACTLQVGVSLGIETTIKAGVSGSGFGEGRSMLSKVVFFVGLHESMTHWGRLIVRPIVDDTVYGEPQKEGWVEKWVVSAYFGVLSWWMLRDEVDALVGVVVAKRGMMEEVGVGEFIGWWLYYMTIVIGVLRIMKGVIWVIMVPLFVGYVDENYDIDLKKGGDQV